MVLLACNMLFVALPCCNINLDLGHIIDLGTIITVILMTMLSALSFDWAPVYFFDFDHPHH